MYGRENQTSFNGIYIYIAQIGILGSVLLGGLWLRNSIEGKW